MSGKDHQSRALKAASPDEVRLFRHKTGHEPRRIKPKLSRVISWMVWAALLGAIWAMIWL
jgi:hypothetical protein